LHLFWSSRSPFVRKVMVVAHEAGLVQEIELSRFAVGAAILDKEVMATNPLNKIPTLIRDDGNALFGSQVICEYLDGLRKPPTFFPQSFEQRIEAQHWQALGDGIMENATLTLGERRRTGPGFSENHVAAYRQKTAAALDYLELRMDAFEAMRFTIGAVAIGVALSHLDFRFSEENWRSGRPKIEKWHAQIASRPSMLATEFVDR